MSKNYLFPVFTACMVLYFISYAAIIGFATLFLQGKGFSNTEIGAFYATSSIFCVAAQVFCGSFLDRHPAVSAKTILAIITIFAAIGVIILYSTSSRPVIFICYVGINMVMLLNSSLFNSFGMEYINNGIPLNYALTRGFGSMFYALASFSIGHMISRLSITCIFIIFFVSQCLLLAVLHFLPSAKNVRVTSAAVKITHTMPDDKLKADSQDDDGFFLFLAKNPRLVLLFVCILMVYISYTSINNFHINIIEACGGKSGELGISTSIASIVELPAMAVFIPLSRKISYQSILRISCFFFFVKITVLTFADSILQIYAAQCLQFFSYGLFIPASAYYINSILPDNEKAKGQSALGIFTFGLSGLIASMLSGILLDHVTVRTMLSIESIIALIGMVGVIICTKHMARSLM